MKDFDTMSAEYAGMMWDAQTPTLAQAWDEGWKAHEHDRDDGRGGRRVTVIRWPGKPYSGRLVYKTWNGLWSWQCDLHLESGYYFGVWDTQHEAFQHALIHASICGRENT